MKELSIELANGYTISIAKEDGKVYTGLVNPNGYMVSDRPLNDYEKSILQTIVKEETK